MKTYAKLFRPLLMIYIVLLFILYGAGLFLDSTVFKVAGASLIILCLICILLFWIYFRKRIQRFSIDISQLLSETQSDALIHFPMPIIIVLDNGEIIWYNSLAQNHVLMTDEMHGKSITEIFSNLSFRGGSQTVSGIALSYKENKYTGYIVRSVQNETAINVIYLIDDTELKYYKEQYLKTRITIMIIMIDNYEEILQSARENDRSQVLPEIEYTIEDYMKNYGGLLCKTERDKYLVVIEENAMQEIVSSRFALLDLVRKIEISQRVPATLSIGVGQHAASLAEAEDMARQALDMSLGRGGDQAAIKTQAGYEFYGGVSKGIEKRTKVKTRIVATALSELIESSSNVIIMGHRFADLDCVGSAIGLRKAVEILGKRAVIAINKDKNLAGPLMAKLMQEHYDDVFYNPDDLIETINEDTLLIIVDVHAKHFIESQQLYAKCNSVVVIDHHRKMVDYIDNAVIFYHEPYASSASEMVAELIQYLDMPKNIGRSEAEALLAGIMLDTKNFVMKAGVRTFEAAAYLKRLGADTVEVRKLFSSPMEAYQKKAKLVSSASVYRNCAIAISVGIVEDIKLIAPQAADELLSISGVEASFVIFENNGQAEISARSMGGVNVQVVMEKLGGGGHLNMAAAQLPETDAESAYQLLLGAIDEYYENQQQN